MKTTPPREDLDLENLEVELLLTAIATRYGYEFRNYGRASMKRRIRRALPALGVRTISALQERLLHQPDDLATFISIVAVHVTSMFRDPAFYQAVRTHVVPRLRTHPFVRVWHAGCSTGEEVYSIAILLEEEGLYDRCRIYATDLADRVLARAERGIYPLRTVEEHAQSYERSGGKKNFAGYYHADGTNAVFDDRLRRNLVFSQHNLVSDASFNEFQLILCRNVLIYFNQTLRRRVHELLYRSLARFGVLALGTRESLCFSPFEDRYEAIDKDTRLYRRIA
jgi:chemotaxis protein methyltransferase CheR